MAILSFVDFCFGYKNSEQDFLLKNINLTIQKGEFILLCGKTGTGKSTLLKNIKKEIAPNGKRSGKIELSTQRVAYISQSPDNQIVMDSVLKELSFGLENIGLEPNEINRRIAETVSFFGIEPFVSKKTCELSGGQKQILNLASNIVMQPDILILDEPTTHLDPVSAKEFVNLLSRLNSELGITVLLSEHFLDDVFPLSDFVVYLSDGKVSKQTPNDFIKTLLKSENDFKAILPSAVLFAEKLGEQQNFPLSVRQARDWLAQSKIELPSLSSDKTSKNDNSILDIKNILYRYNKNDNFVLQDLSLKINDNEIHSILGGNGGGKSTLLHLICGTIKPIRGKIKKASSKKIGLLLQNPMAIFTADNAHEELKEFKSSHRYSEDDISKICDKLGISGLLPRHPYDLSGGEMQRLALAKILLLSPDIVLLDEPTNGLDAVYKEQLAEIILNLKKSGKTVVLTTHDLNFAVKVSDRCSMLFGGDITATDTTRNFFGSNIYYTTEINRITRGFADNYITIKDVNYG